MRPTSSALAAAYPPVARLKILFDLVSLFTGLKEIVDGPNLDFWLREYAVGGVSTLPTYRLLEREDTRPVDADYNVLLELDGGVTMRAIVRRLKAGQLDTLRMVVLRTRPHADTLMWRIPIVGWSIPGTESVSGTDDAEPPPDRSDQQLGFSLTSRDAIYLRFDEGGELRRPKYWEPPPPRMDVPVPVDIRPHVHLVPGLPWQGGSGQIGGVMFANTARVENLVPEEIQTVGIDPTTGSFNFVVQGQNVRLEEENLRKFVTALWAVYFGAEDPGISIDPIAPESDVQLVRFIGNVLDTHLARTMLDADYYMKQCAIGKVRPPIPGFKSVDDLIGKHGAYYAGIGRRFWFVPQDMQFRRCGDALLFDGGRMTVLTEKMFSGQGGISDPADQAFAQFMTDQYWEFAAVNPVYEELYEYARLTALAKYLKQSGVSLKWFLLTNRQLVLREQIPGTVPTLRAPSKSLQGTEWWGGVELKTDMSESQPGRYVIDESAARAIRRALSQRAPDQQSRAGGETGHTRLSQPSPAGWGLYGRPRGFRMRCRPGHHLSHRRWTAGKGERALVIQ